MLNMIPINVNSKFETWIEGYNILVDYIDLITTNTSALNINITNNVTTIPTDYNLLLSIRDVRIANLINGYNNLESQLNTKLLQLDALSNRISNLEIVNTVNLAGRNNQLKIDLFKLQIDDRNIRSKLLNVNNTRFNNIKISLLDISTKLSALTIAITNQDNRIKALELLFIDTIKATTIIPSEITKTSAKIGININTLGIETNIDVTFYWKNKDDLVYMNSVTSSYNTAGIIYYTINGLTSNSEYLYHVELKSYPNNILISTNDYPINTLPEDDITTNQPTTIGSVSFIANGYLKEFNKNLNANLTVGYFLYKKSTATTYTQSNTFKCSSFGTYELEIPNLTAGETYNYKFVIEDKSNFNKMIGKDVTLTTVLFATPSFSIYGIDNISTTQAILQINIKTLNSFSLANTKIAIQYGSSTTSYTQLTNIGKFSKLLTGLAKNTQYTVKVLLKDFISNTVATSNSLLLNTVNDSVDIDSIINLTNFISSDFNSNPNLSISNNKLIAKDYVTYNTKVFNQQDSSNWKSIKLKQIIKPTTILSIDTSSTLTNVVINGTLPFRFTDYSNMMLRFGTSFIQCSTDEISYLGGYIPSIKNTDISNSPTIKGITAFRNNEIVNLIVSTTDNSDNIKQFTWDKTFKLYENNGFTMSTNNAVVKYSSTKLNILETSKVTSFNNTLTTNLSVPLIGDNKDIIEIGIYKYVLSTTGLYVLQNNIIINTYVEYSLSNAYFMNNFMMDNINYIAIHSLTGLKYILKIDNTNVTTFSTTFTNIGVDLYDANVLANGRKFKIFYYKNIPYLVIKNNVTVDVYKFITKWNLIQSINSTIIDLEIILFAGAQYLITCTNSQIDFYYFKNDKFIQDNKCQYLLNKTLPELTAIPDDIFFINRIYINSVLPTIECNLNKVYIDNDDVICIYDQTTLPYLTSFSISGTLNPNEELKQIYAELYI